MTLRWVRMTLRRFDGGIYLDRWGFQHASIGGLLLHRMDAPDPGLDLHDHPWAFVSLVLSGGYDEERALCRDAPMLAQIYAQFAARWHTCTRGAVEQRNRWSVRLLRLDECHRITRLHRAPTWTLVLHGPRRRGWGFYMPDGYMDERTYDDTVRVNRRDLWQEGGYVESLLNEEPA